MFGLKHNECVGFESRWEVKKVCSETSTQTSEFATQEKGSNTGTSKGISIQTETQEIKQRKHEEDMEKLAEWLKKIYPGVTKEISNINTTSKFFKNYDCFDEDDQDGVAKILQMLSTQNKNAGDQASHNSILTWSSNGKYLAVTNNYKHTSWCHHAGRVLLYYLNKNKQLVQNDVNKNFTTDSCVKSLEFHLTNPGILAAGTHLGSIYIWNINETEIVCSKTCHDDYITQISWSYDLDKAKSVILASSSTDGYLKLWKFNQTEASLRLRAKYKIKYPVLGYVNSTITISPSESKFSTTGVVCFDFSKFQPEIFVVGLEGGLIVQCSVLGATTLRDNKKEPPLYDPVVKYYAPHNGEVISTKFSPNRREMFMSFGTDGEVRIYIIDQDDPAQVLFLNHPVNDVSWVPNIDKLITAATVHGRIQVFNLKTAKEIDFDTDESINNSNKVALLCLAVNKSKIQFVVTGDMKGNLNLWSVPWYTISRKC